MLTSTCKYVLKQQIKLFLGVFVFGILFSCAKTPQQIIEKPTEFHKHRNSIVRVENKIGFFSKGIGSGFFVQRNKVATNIHVIAHSGPVYIKSADKKTTWKVEGVAAYDVKNDLAILKVIGEGEALPLGNSDVVRSNEPISIIGFPDEKYKVTEATLHSIRNSDKWLRIKVRAVSGSSGGPVLNSKGQVIGIQASGDDSFSDAIPSYMLKGLLTQSESTESLEHWHKREPIRSYVHYLKGVMNYDKKRYDKAIADFDKAIQLNPESTNAYFRRGNAKYALRDHESAINDYDKAIKLNPQYATAYYNRGLAKRQLGDHKGAINDYDKAIKLNPQYVIAYINRGVVKSKLGNYKDAISDYNKAIKQNPQYAIAYINRGYAKSKLSDYEGAISDYNKVIKLNPQYSIAYNNRGHVKFKLGNHKGAINDYDKAIKLNPKEATAYHNRGIAKGHLGDHKSAISDYDKTIKLNPLDAKAYHDRARAKEALGQHDAAKADFEKAKELDPDFAK
ncbi:hypothetical protein C6501_04825 [Candidatus Poribacteria bacterium]|nr:MAG: hypothetical protein C6501_04825 [Candidatus Poribacteria bacterium]